MFHANTVHFSSNGKIAVEIKRDNGDGTYATVWFDKIENGSGYIVTCGEYVTPEEKIVSTLNNDLTILKDRV